MHADTTRPPLLPRALRALLLLLSGFVLLAAPAAAQEDDDLVQLDFDDVELEVVIDTIARLTNTNFIYDDRVRGRVTIISPTPVTRAQAYAVFESVLQVKGFTTVPGPGGATKIVPVREAKQSSVPTEQGTAVPANRDRFVTRLIPLRYIDAESIVSTLQPLVSGDAAMAAYEPTNTVILTESQSNIRRILSILDAIDVETFKEELAVIRIEHADAATMADQIAEIYEADVSQPTAGGRPNLRQARAARRRAAQQQQAQEAAEGLSRGKVRIITDERTNSLILLAARSTLDDIRGLVRRLDVPVLGGGRIHVYYLKHADAEEIAGTLSDLVSAAPSPDQVRGQGAQAQALRSVVTELAEGITVTADPGTNSLVIQASQEGFSTLSQVIAQLDIARRQVLVEALILEVDVTDSQQLGFNGLLRLIDGDLDIELAQSSDAAALATLGAAGVFPPAAAAAPFIANAIRDSTDGGTNDGTTIQGVIRATASDTGTNILSAPHILTSDNEEAEIQIGNDIPIISSRVQSAAGIDDAGDSLATSVNVERQDIGVTLRVTPQITEGDSLRLRIFQEITNINEGLQAAVGGAENVGVALSERRIENNVVVKSGETVVIGGLISDNYNDSISKIPWLGDIPILGWLFKTTSRTLQKVNLLVFLTPHIIRTPEDLEKETIRKREEFAEHSGSSYARGDEELARERERKIAAEEAEAFWSPTPDPNAAREAVLEHTLEYPTERMYEIQREKEEQREAEEAARRAALRAPAFYVQAAVYGDEETAVDQLTALVDAGHESELLTSEADGNLLYEIRVGPYETMEEAQRVGGIIQRAHDLAPAVVVAEEPEAPPGSAADEENEEDPP